MTHCRPGPPRLPLPRRRRCTGAVPGVVPGRVGDSGAPSPWPGHAARLDPPGRPSRQLESGSGFKFRPVTHVLKNRTCVSVKLPPFPQLGWLNLLFTFRFQRLHVTQVTVAAGPSDQASISPARDRSPP